MSYTFTDVLARLGQEIDIVYLLNEEEDRYETLRDNALFHEEYGDGGSCKALMKSLFENSQDERVVKGKPYGVFSEINHGEVKIPSLRNGNIHLRIGGQDAYLSLKKISMDEKIQALLISSMSKETYNESRHANDSMNVIKTAYLFTMNVDLKKDLCGTMSMSEIDTATANAPEIKYSEWRDMTTNMFLPYDKPMFRAITDPEYLMENLSYERSRSIDMQMMNLEGVFIWVKLIFHRINTGNDDDFKFLFMVEDIHDSHSRLIEEVNKFENMATHDTLTGLLNRGAIDSEVRNRVKRGREEHHPVCLMMLDIDHFKQVNDTYGHHEGDRVLTRVTELANLLLGYNGGILGRWGGEEFIAVVDACKAEGTEIAERIRETVENETFQEVGHLTISLGIIEVEEDETIETAYNRVDAAMYEAKNTGRNRVVSA